jgi:hypothetical protein
MWAFFTASNHSFNLVGYFGFNLVGSLLAID